MTEDHERAAELLTSHPAVAKARVSGATELTAYLIPDEREAPLLHRSGLLQARGRLAGLSWHEPSVDLRLAQVNRSETDFLYREIFVDNAYFRHGIALPEDAVVVDVGANIGMFTLAAAAHSARIRIVAV